MIFEDLARDGDGDAPRDRRQQREYDGAGDWGRRLGRLLDWLGVAVSLGRGALERARRASLAGVVGRWGVVHLVIVATDRYAHRRGEPNAPMTAASGDARLRA